MVVSVRDAASGRFVPHAFVVAERATLLGVTDSSGVLRARVASGSHGVEVRSFGYVARKYTVIIVSDTTTSLDVRLTQAARSLDTVKVETDEPAPSVLGISNADERQPPLTGLFSRGVSWIAFETNLCHRF
jgi:hypothetical protein